MDNMVVSRYSGNREAAQEFINFILRPDMNAQNANTLKYASPLSMDKVKEYLDPSLLNDPIIYPSHEAIGRMELNKPFEVGSLYEQILEDYILKKENSFSITTSI
jgi:spermidine/putrescine-binding protein